jgi:predicted Zn-dependent protease with MMP-like domain
MRQMPGSPPPLRRILISAMAALALGIAVATLIGGFSSSSGVRLLQGLAMLAAGAVLIGGAALLVMLRMAGWKDPESEEDFEAIVRRSEELAAQGPAFVDPNTDEGFSVLVRAALEELPLEFHAALEHVAVVVSDGGAARHAYGLYEGDTVAQDYFHDRIVIFRDTLLRDFGHDPDLLKDQVTRTVRHELAHHLGWGERGVRGLGL